MGTPEYPLAGKRVLIMSPHFFGYENAIADVVRTLEVHTIVVLDRPSNVIWTKAATRVLLSAVASRMIEYIRSMRDRYGYQGSDEIIVIREEALTVNAVHLPRESFPNVRRIYYDWGLLRNYSHLREIPPQFDACFSFDPGDYTSTKGPEHLPSLYVDEYRDLPAELV